MASIEVVTWLREDMKTIAEVAPEVAALLARMFVEEPALAQESAFLISIRRMAQFTPRTYLEGVTLERLALIPDLSVTVERAKIYWKNRPKHSPNTLERFEDGLRLVDARILDGKKEGTEDQIRLAFIARDTLLRLYAFAYIKEREIASHARHGT